MKANNKAEIRRLLEGFRNFQECVVEDVKWLDFGTTVEVQLDYTWTDAGQIRPDLEHPEIIVMKFRLVQEFRLSNALNDVMCAEPEQIGWGISEVDVVRLFNEDFFLRQYQFLPAPFHHVAFMFGGDRRIDIIFSELEVSKQPHLALR